MTMTAEELVACVRADQNYLITLEKTVEEFKNELVKLKSENSLLHCQVDCPRYLLYH